jgi:YD repeat-containing protein
MKQIALFCVLSAFMVALPVLDSGDAYQKMTNSFQIDKKCVSYMRPLVHSIDAKEASSLEDPRYVGDPVDVVLGEMRSFPQVDFTLLGSYQPLVFSRICHSSKEEDGPFGFGWSHSYNITLTKRSDEWFEMVDEEGRLSAFVFRPAEREFSPIMWNKSSLTRQLANPGAAHPLYRMVCQAKDGVKYVFPDVFWKEAHVRYHVSAIEYTDGSAIRFAPDDGSLPTRITDAHGRVIRLSYSNGRIAEIFEPGRPADQPIRYGYDDQGNLTSVAYPVDPHTTRIRRYYYTDPHDVHNLTRIQDEHGTSFHYEYEQSGRCTVSQGEDFGAGPYYKHTFAYDPQELKTVLKRWRGSEIFTEIIGYTKDERITKIEYMDSGETKEFAYDLHMNGASTLEISESSAGQNDVFKKVVRFDDKFNVTDISVGTAKSKDEKPETLRIKVFHDDPNNPAAPTKIVDQNDNLLNISPESFNKIEEIFRVREAEELGQPPNVQAFLARDDDSFSAGKARLVRNKQGLIKKVIGADGATCEYSYDGAGRYVRLIIRNGKNRRKVQIAYDWLGRVTLVRVEEDAEVQKESYTYEATDLFDKSASYAINKAAADGLKTQFLYNKAGLLWKVVRFEAGGPSVTTYEHDAFGNLVRIVLPDGGEIKATYDSRDRLIDIQTPRRFLEPAEMKRAELINSKAVARLFLTQCVKDARSNLAPFLSCAFVPFRG